ncbi:MAG: hypothetical protein R2710_08545 [Acidimicrobiales bacterium]
MSTLRDRSAMALARATWRTHRGLAAAWWGLVALRAVLPVALTLGMGALIACVQDGTSVTAPLAVVAGSFIAHQHRHPAPHPARRRARRRTSGHLRGQLTRRIRSRRHRPPRAAGTRR